MENPDIICIKGVAGITTIIKSVMMMITMHYITKQTISTNRIDYNQIDSQQTIQFLTERRKMNDFEHIRFSSECDRHK
jgi:hypothetical protein